MILSFFANLKSSSYSYKTEKCIWFNWIVQPGIMKNIFFVNKSLGRWRVIFNFVGGPFLPPPTNIYKMPVARH